MTGETWTSKNLLDNDKDAQDVINEGATTTLMVDSKIDVCLS